MHGNTMWCDQALHRRDSFARDTAERERRVRHRDKEGDMTVSARITCGVVAFALIVISGQATRAGTVFRDSDFDSRVLLGCSQPTCTAGSTNASAALVEETVNSFTLRFGLNVNADDSAGGGLVLENGIATYEAGFTIDFDNYDVILSTSRNGALRRNADALGCEGSVALSAMSAPSLTINGVPGPALAQLALPAASIENGGGDADLEIATAVQRQVIEMRNRSGGDRFLLSFSMGAAAISDSCEVSARFGAANAGTTGCSACDYPGDGNRDIEADGLFVTVTAVNRCGDGVQQAPEQCDRGPQNGTFESCCGNDCRFKPSTSRCRSPGASAACDPAETCTGSSVFCPDDAKAPAGTACEDDGDSCTTDMCDDGGGGCLHIEVPTPCPALCGNGVVDPGEECDLGAVDNGAPTNCCDETCKNRPNGAPCTDETFCNGEESCAFGACAMSTGDPPCSELGACAVCDEANNLCDTSACPPTPTAGTPPTATPTTTPPVPASATPTATSPPTPLASDEIIVNTYTTGVQAVPAIASLAGGDFVVVWRSDTQDGDDYGIFGQRLDASGARIGMEFPVNTKTAGEQRDQDVVGTPDGGFAVVWSDDEERIVARFFASSGAPASPEIQVNETTGILTTPAIAADAAGRLIVAWNRNDKDILAQRLDSAGVAIGTEFVVRATTEGEQEKVGVGSASGGNFVVAWLNTPPIGSTGILAQRYQSNGMPQGTAFEVPIATSGRPDNLAVTVAPDGGFVIAFEARPNNIRASRFDADAMFGLEVLVAGGTVNLGAPDVSSDPRGNFTFVWDAQTAGNDGFDVFGRRYAADGSGEEAFQLNQYTTDSQRSPVVASGADGSFVAAWSSTGQDGDLQAIVARRFACTASSCPVCVGDCDGDGRVSIGELIIGVNVALGRRPLGDCESFDANGSGTVQIAELIRAVNNALNGCA
jgi:hypothetical protein